MMMGVHASKRVSPAQQLGERLTLLDFSPNGKHLLIGVVRLKPGDGKRPNPFPFPSLNGEKKQQEEPPSGRLEVWDVMTRRLASTVPNQVMKVDGMTRRCEFPRCEFSPDGRHLAIPGQRTIEVWDLASGQKILTLDTGQGTLARVAFSLNGTEILGAMLDSIQVWDVRTGRVRSSVPLERPIAKTTFERPRPHMGGDMRRMMMMWETQTIAQHPFVAFSPGRDRIASGGDPIATVWETKTGRALFRLEGHQDAVTNISFSPDGSWIATASPSRGFGMDPPELIVWDARTGRRLSSPVGHANPITDLAFSPDSQFLVSADNGPVPFWILASGGSIRRGEFRSPWTLARFPATPMRSPLLPSAPTAHASRLPAVTRRCGSGTSPEGRSCALWKATRRKSYAWPSVATADSSHP